MIRLIRLIMDAMASVPLGMPCVRILPEPSRDTHSCWRSRSQSPFRIYRMGTLKDDRAPDVGKRGRGAEGQRSREVEAAREARRTVSTRRAMATAAAVLTTGPRTLSSGGGPKAGDHRAGVPSTQEASDDRLLRDLVWDALSSFANRRLTRAVAVIGALGDAFVVWRAPVVHPV